MATEGSIPTPAGPPTVNGRQTSGVDPHPDPAGYSPAQAHERIAELLGRRSKATEPEGEERPRRKARQPVQDDVQDVADLPDEDSDVLEPAEGTKPRKSRRSEPEDDQDDDDQDDGTVNGSASEDDDDDEGEEGDDEDEPAEEVDFEYAGNTYKVPKPLVEGAMRQADYTRAKQEVTAQAASIVAERKAMTTRLLIAQELAPVLAQVQNTEQAIKQLEGQMPDPSVDLMGYVTLDKQIRGLRAGLEQLKSAAAERGTELAAQEQSARAELQRAGNDYIKSVIPKWADANYRSSVAQYAVSIGYSKDELEMLTDPRVVKVLSDSMQYQRIKKAQPAIRKRVANAPPVVKPTGTKSQAVAARDSIDSVKARAKRTGSVKDAEAAMLAVLQAAKRTGGRRARR